MYKHPEQRVGVFVDTANMYHSAKNLYNANVNFAEVLSAAVADRKLVRAIAYVVTSPTGEELGFFDALRDQGFEVKSKDLQVFSSGMKKADWDVGLAVDAIKLADKLDAVIIVSGDGDYAPLVQYLRENKGCLVEVAAFEETLSAKLRDIVDDFVNMSEDLDRFIMTSGKKRRVYRKKATTKSKKPATKSKTTTKTAPKSSTTKKKRKVIF